ncbi:helix-turn-helix domain-containing protein [Erwinia typographi]|uniref:helix-turn-helix domain-containing protein n=1 Tax=Erwinia typographi TaxID=371042 RepID=UPI000907A71C
MIGKRLRTARKAAKMTQTELATRAGIDELTVSRISHYETGTHSPNFQQACRFAAVLGVPECYFYCRDDVLAAHLLAIHKRHKKFRLSPAEITELEKAQVQLQFIQETIDGLLNRRIDIEISEELPSSLMP